MDMVGINSLTGYIKCNPYISNERETMKYVHAVCDSCSSLKFHRFNVPVWRHFFSPSPWSLVAGLDGTGLDMSSCSCSDSRSIDRTHPWDTPARLPKPQRTLPAAKTQVEPAKSWKMGTPEMIFISNLEMAHVRLVL